MSQSAALDRSMAVALCDEALKNELFAAIYTTGAFTDMTLTGTLTLGSGADIVFSGTTGQNEIRLTDNLADALSIKITSGADILVVKTTDSSESLYLLSAATQKLSFFGVTAVVQGTAYTQTYSTGDKTVANPTAAALTDNGGGASADGTIGAIGTFTPSVAWNGSSVYPSAADATSINTRIVALTDAVKELSAMVNKLVADELDTRQALTSVIDDLQAFGLVA